MKRICDLIDAIPDVISLVVTLFVCAAVVVTSGFKPNSKASRGQN
jgi:hypothetical protein